MVEVAKAAVWKLALIVLRRQTTDPWMNAIEGRVFVERGSTVRGRQRALHSSAYGLFGAWPASWPTGVDRRRGTLLHRRAVDFLQALVGDEFRAARRSHTLETTGRCVVHRRVCDERAASAI